MPSKKATRHAGPARPSPTPRASATTAETAWREREERLRLAQSYGGVGVWGWDVETDELTWEPELEQLYGLEPGTIRTYTDWASRVHPEDLARIEAERDAALSRHEPFHSEFRIRHADGSERWLASTGRADYDEAGRARRVLGVNIDITAQKQTEVALRESEERFHRIVQTADEGVITINAESLTDFVNPKMAQMLGYTVEEMLGRRLEDFMDDEGRALLAKYLQRRQQGIAEQFEFRFVRKDGSDLWTSISTNPLTDPSGAYLGAVAMVTDITERKRTEGALRESEERFRTLFENAGDAILLLEGDRAIDCNARTLEMFGCQTRDQIVGHSPDDFSPPRQPNGRESHEFAREKITAALAGQPQFFEWMQRKLDGTPFPAEVTLNTVKVRDKVVLQSIVRDLTERRKAELDHLNTLALLERTGEIAKVGGWELDLRTMEHFRTLETCRILEIDPREAASLEQGIDFLAPEARPIMWAAYQAAVDHGTPYDVELPLITAKGRRIWVRIQGSAVMENGKAVKLLGAFHDITERKQAQEALAASESALLQANENLHRNNEDLERRVAERTAQLRALTMELTNTEEWVRRQAADSLHEGLMQLLSAAMMTVTTLKPHLKDGTPSQRLTDLDECLREAIKVCRTLTYELSPPILHSGGLGAALHWLGHWHREKYELTVDVEAAEGIDVEEKELRIALFRAAHELLFNVSKHAAVRQARLHLHRLPGDIVRLVISDTGAGFDPAAVRAREGSSGGFGLFSLRERVEAFGGYFDIRSAPGRGSQFTITVPSGAGALGGTVPRSHAAGNPATPWNRLPSTPRW